MSEIKRWLFNVEDENGDTFYLAEEEFVGTYDEAIKAAELLADEWERRTGGMVMRIELERRGAAVIAKTVEVITTQETTCKLN